MRGREGARLAGHEPGGFLTFLGVGGLPSGERLNRFLAGSLSTLPARVMGDA